MDGAIMTPHMKWAIAGIVVGLILWIVSPWLTLGVVFLAIAIPAGAWWALGPVNRRRIRGMRNRGQLP
jgi:cytochrome c biogenesis factor